MKSETKPEPVQSGAAATPEIDFDRVADASQKSMLAFAHLHSRLIRNALEVNAELLDFARKRVGEDLRTNDRLAKCTNITDAIEVMSGFYSKAFEEYAAEANRVVRLSTEAARRSMEEAEREGRELASGE